MPDLHAQIDKSDAAAGSPAAKPTHRRRGRRLLIGGGLVLLALLVAARLAMPWAIRSYVNRTIDQSPLYDGKIGGVTVHLWRGAYSIEDVRLIKTTGNVPVPLFSAARVDLALQWDALLAGEVVGRVAMVRPELNFVDGDSKEEDQTGVGGGPWLKMLKDLFPFRINSAAIEDGAIHFRAFHTNPPVDLYLSKVQATVRNLTNIHDETAPLIATVDATALAMDHAKLEYAMKLDPFSYHPTFDLAVRLLDLDVTRTNALAEAYGGVDFEGGRFDLVIEAKAREGRLEGYVKPLFRDLAIINLKKDLPERDPLGLFWEAVVGVAAQVFKNQPRDQFATYIPLEGDVSSVESDMMALIGNVLRNAFIQAYLPQLEGVGDDAAEWMELGPGRERPPPGRFDLDQSEHHE